MQILVKRKIRLTPLISGSRIFSFTTYWSIRVMILNKGMQPEWSLYANTDCQCLTRKIRITPMISGPRIFSFSTYWSIRVMFLSRVMKPECFLYANIGETQDSPNSTDLRFKNLQFHNILVHLSDGSEQGNEAWMISLCKYWFSASDTQDSPSSTDLRFKNLQFHNILVH